MPGARMPVLDMTPEGEFRGPAPAASRSWLDRALLRVGGVAALLAVIAGGLAIAAVALVALSVLLPLALGAGAVAAGVIWWRVRRARREIALRRAAGGVFR